MFQEVEKHGLLSEDRAARLMSGAVAAVKHMHSHRVAHRDLKLENLLLADVGGDDVKVCDLGLALHVQEGARATKVCGTKSYTAPEILAHHAGPSHPGYDPLAADIYSLGVCIFAMVAGFFPLEVARRADWRFVKLEEAQASGGGSTCAVIYSFYSKSCPFSPPLAVLLDGMLQLSPSSRWTIHEVAAAAFFHGRLPEPPAVDIEASSAGPTCGRSGGWRRRRRLPSGSGESSAADNDTDAALGSANSPAQCQEEYKSAAKQGEGRSPLAQRGG